MTVARLFLALAVLAASACDDGRRPSETPMTLSYTLRLDRYESAEPPTPLRVSNETLLLPLGGDEAVQELTRSAPGDLVLAYTRIDCSVGDPTPYLSRPDIEVPQGETVQLVEIEVDELAGDGRSGDWQGGVCFALLVDGAWTMQLPPTTVDPTGEKRDAVAIFFPLFADVTEIRYRILE